MSDNSGVRLTDSEVERLCLDAYHALVGKVVLATEVECYQAGEALTLVCDPPALVRISRMADRTVDAFVTRWMDADVCDPAYDVSLVDLTDARFEGIEPSWIYGVSHYRDGTSDVAYFQLASDEIQDRYAETEAVDTTWIDMVSRP